MSAPKNTSELCDFLDAKFAGEDHMGKMARSLGWCEATLGCILIAINVYGDNHEGCMKSIRETLETGFRVACETELNRRDSEAA